MKNAITNLNELCEMMRTNRFSERELMELPTFGGEEPSESDVDGPLWSWDASRVIVGLCSDDFEVVWRPVSAEIEYPAYGNDWAIYHVSANDEGSRDLSMYDLLEHQEIDLATLGEIEIDSDYNTVADVDGGVADAESAIRQFIDQNVVQSFVDGIIAALDWDLISEAYRLNNFEPLTLDWQDDEWEIGMLPCQSSLVQLPAIDAQLRSRTPSDEELELLLTPQINAQLMKRWDTKENSND